MTGARFSFARVMAVLVKEFVQIRRDRLTFAMMVGIPILQLTLFGFAINNDPKALPTAVLSNDHSRMNVRCRRVNKSDSSIHECFIDAYTQHRFCFCEMDARIDANRLY